MKKSFLFLSVVMLLCCVSCGRKQIEKEIPQKPENDAVQSQQSNFIIKNGTWLSFDGNEYSRYYFFDSNDKIGSFSTLQDGTGLSFTYKFPDSSSEYGDNNIVFYMGSVDNPAPAIIEKVDENTLKIKWSEGIEEKLTYVSDKSANEFIFYSNDELALMALNYYSKNFDYAPTSATAITNDDGSVTIQLYNSLGDHNSICASWYTVNRFTAEGVDDITGDTIILK